MAPTGPVDPLEEIQKTRKKERREILSLEKGTSYRFPLSAAPDAASLKALNAVLPGRLLFREEKGDLVITVREKNVEELRTRSAGRKQLPRELSPNPANPFDLLPEGVQGVATVNKVEALIRAVGSDRAAELLGMSKTGMYKRLRTARAKKIPAGPFEEPLGDADWKF
ncbi:MAG: hypothetical protein ACI4OJ_02125 [Lachnospiraceae bacterium]